METTNTPARKLTVSAKWLEMAAISLEMEAEQSLRAWILVGQTERYCQNMRKAAVLRRAKAFKNIGERREYLRNNGVQA